MVPVVVALEPERFRLAGTPLRYVLTSVLMHRTVEMRALFTVILGLMLGSGTAAGFECTGVTLPSSDIAVIHRSDGSGTTFNFAYYLTKAAPDWKVGAMVCPPEV